MVRTPAAAGAAAGGSAPPSSSQAAIPSLTSIDDIVADDDLLSDMLLDKLGFAPAISTHKMNPHYRSQRWNTEKLLDLVREKVMIERDIPAAFEGLCQILIVKDHMDKKSLKARGAFEVHAKRYLEAYLPDSGFEFAITNRYIRSIHSIPNAASLYDASAFAESSAAGAARNAAAAASSPPPPSTAKASGSASSSKATKPRRSHNATSSIEPEGLKKDLCVVALRAFQPGDVIHCKGALRDLSKEQDEALRFEASHTRSSLAHETAFASDGARDFSIIRSTRRNLTQVLLGPSRFVNHDCDPNAQFNKVGQHMTFKVIKPIQQNEEILVLYGEHYFGIDNCECLCATCEKRGTGVFSAEQKEPPTGATNPVIDAGTAAVDEGSEGAAEGDSSILVNTASSGSSELEPTTTARRAPSKRIKTASNRTSPNGDSPRAGTPPPSRNDSAILKALTKYEGQDRNRFPASPRHNANRPDFFPSDRELVSPEAAKGKLSRCLTCRAPFFTAAWYDKDECVRCERHFRIYQADYPYRSPTEAKWKKMFDVYEAKMAQLANGGGKGQSGANKRKAADPLSDEEEYDEEDEEESVAKSKAKGKGKAVAKAKAPRISNASSSRSASSSKKKTAAASPFSDGRSASSRGSSPVHLTPLRSIGTSHASGRSNGGSRDEDDDDAVVRKPSRPRKSIVDVDTDEDTIERQLSSHGHTSSAPPAARGGDDSDSDLSDPPTNLSEAEGSVTGGRKFSSFPMSAAPSMESALSTSSEGSLDRPCGPKMLGKEANVENLAKHWGIQEGEGRRIRKPSVNGPVSLADRVGSSSGRKPSGHRRTDSATSFKRETSAEGSEDKKIRPALPSSSSKSHSNGHKRSQSRDVSLTIGSPSKTPLAGREPSSSEERAAGKAALGQRVKQEMGTPETFAVPGPSSSKKSKVATSTPPPALDHNGIATHGTARTSTDNLSKAWSAPVGASRTRNKVVREPSLLAAIQRGGSPATSSQSRRGSSDAGRAGSSSRGGKKGRSGMAEASPSTSRPSSSGASSVRSVSDTGSADDEEQSPRVVRTPGQREMPLREEERRTNGDGGGEVARVQESNGTVGGVASSPATTNGPASSPGGAAAGPIQFTHVRRNLRLYHRPGATAGGATPANNVSQPLAAITGSATNGASPSTNGSSHAATTASEPPVSRVDNTSVGGASLLPPVDLQRDAEDKPATHAASVPPGIKPIPSPSTAD